MRFLAKQSVSLKLTRYYDTKIQCKQHVIDRLRVNQLIHRMQRGVITTSYRSEFINLELYIGNKLDCFPIILNRYSTKNIIQQSTYINSLIKSYQDVLLMLHAYFRKHGINKSN